ncbi:hypothetical protein ALC57_02205 [Trachymyrmex cornetzi]|uniref:Uncharacterized protein n=1 Tax=Trachymyrmex cornetzi TaxID=471704 RepID=A0A151JP05_9HYME|nr:hypothetical protein ALC57_02205 [Trachymyrmex cornetzi]
MLECRLRRHYLRIQTLKQLIEALRQVWHQIPQAAIRQCISCADITKIRQEARDKAKEMQISVQTYVIVVGSIKNVSDSYVTIDEVLYSTESTLEAFDICFKAFDCNRTREQRHNFVACS